MSDTENQTTPDQTNTGPTEEEMLTALKAKATTLGVKFSNNIGIESLRERIAEHEKAQEATNATGSVPAAAEANPNSHMAIRKRLQKEELKLIRCRITNMNPSKADLKGEIFSVRNKYIGTVRKFIPFGEATENGYHIENILLKQLKARKFLQVKTNPKTNVVESQRFVPEFAIEILEPLTETELKQLAAQQAAAAGLTS